MSSAHLLRFAAIARNARSTDPARHVLPLEGLEPRTLFAAGDLDPTFGLGGQSLVEIPFGITEVTAADFANGRLVVGGSGSDGSTTRVALAVFDQNGQPLKSFSGDGVESELLSVPGGVVDLVVQPADNKIVVLVGDGIGGPSVVARFNTNGSLDTAFGQRTVNLRVATDIALSPSGDVIVGGQTADGNVGLARFGSSGTPKGVLNTGVRGATGDVVVHGNGKIVVCGNVPEEGIGFDNQLVRVKADFSGVDTTFSGDGVVALPDGGIDDFANAITVDRFGQLFVATVEAESAVRVYRVLDNGSLDPTFADSSFAASAPRADDISVALDGAITVSGEHTGGNFYVARFKPGGGLDTTFGNGDGLIEDRNDNETVAGRFHNVQIDGRILVAGDFFNPSSFVAERHRVDNTFSTGAAALGADRVLRVTGSTGNDDIVLDDFPGNEDVAVTINGRTSFFTRAAIDRIEVQALAGNDAVRSAPSREEFFGQLPRTINGGAREE
jgi:uncharacterized delta-60 repeat protein